jgi:hypothetical protein
MKDEKVLNIACFIKSLLAEAEALKAEKKTLEQRARVANNKAESLKRYIQENIQEGEKFKDSRCAISWRSSTSVLVKTDPEMLPSEYQKITIEAKKADIKKALQAGQKIDGCELDEKENLQIK